MKHQNSELVELIAEYFPKSELFKEKFNQFSHKQRYPYLALVIFTAVFYFCFSLLFPLVDPGELGTKEAQSAFLAAFVFRGTILLSPLMILLIDCEYTGSRARVGKRLVAKLKWKKEFDKLLENPFSSELILGTVQAIEKEVDDAEKPVLERLERKKALYSEQLSRIETIQQSIKQRLKSPGPRHRILDQARLERADKAFDLLSEKVAEVMGELAHIGSQIQPVRALAKSLWDAHSESLEIESIDQALAVARIGERYVGLDVLELKAISDEAIANLKLISGITGSFEEAVLEVEEEFGHELNLRS